MTTLQISKQKALALYPTASNEFKAMLEETFGKEFFTVKITDRIKTYEDACEILGEEPINERGFRCYGFSDDEIALRKLKTITRALNEGWKADWNDSNQQKWVPYFTVSSFSTIRITTSRMRLRVTLPAFALKATNSPRTRGNNLSISGMIF